MNKLLSLLLASMLLLTACDNKQEENANSKPILKIGIALPLTGNVSEEGENSKKAVLMAKESYNGKNFDIDIIIEDDALNSMRDAIIANKFINIDNVDIIISAYSTSGGVIAPITKEHQVPYICICNNKEVANGINNFTNWQIPEIASQKLVEYFKKQHAKKVVLFSMQHVGYEQYRSLLKDYLQKDGIEFKEFTFAPENKDFMIMLYQAQNFDADFWILNAFSPSLDILRKKMLDAKIVTPIVSIQAFGMVNNKYPFNSGIFVYAPEGDASFKQRLIDEGAKGSFSVPAYFYDSINLIIKVCDEFYDKNKRMPTRVELAKSIFEKQTYDGVVGKLTIQNDGIIKSPSVLKMIQNGETVDYIEK